VFLRKDSDRISKLGKEFKIPKHWSHFSSTSEEQKAACEARVSSYTEADRQRIQSQARGQRLKLIQRWFWKCYSSHGASMKIFQKMENVTQYTRNTDRFRAAEPGIIEDFKTVNPAIFEKQASEIKLLSKAYNDGGLESGTIPIVPTELLKAFEARIHILICQEICLYLSSRKGQEILLDMTSILLELIKEYEHKNGYKDAVSHLMRDIGYIPWASEFARLEAEAGQRVAA
jgi:hypothetical protein